MENTDKAIEAEVKRINREKIAHLKSDIIEITGRITNAQAAEVLAKDPSTQIKITAYGLHGTRVIHLSHINDNYANAIWRDHYEMENERRKMEVELKKLELDALPIQPTPADINVTDDMISEAIEIEPPPPPHSIQYDPDDLPF